MKNQKTLLPCWWENELVQNHVEKLSGKFLVKQTNVCYDSAILALHLHGPEKLYVYSPKNVPNNVHSSTFHNDPK